ncbi:MAG: single-stranded-DNA-specific exonuclease RecJ [Lachnospiraceae bacterium]|nr:single-stranded-DNA-specific exonuclease RecJ [Lachnospiraceae bacterium]
MEKWFVAAKKADFNKWAEQFQISPVLARILRNRDLTEEAQIERFLYGTLEACYEPWLMKDIDRAVEQVLEAIDKDIRIRVIGDYDVDGICSAYIMSKGLQLLGARVDTAIPHRIHDGYGLNNHLIELARQDGVELIITCDNGIAAAPQIELAKELGIEVIVTDHHEVPFVEENGIRKELLPPALAVVDPKQEQCGYPFKGICGGVVAYKLIQALLQKTQNEKLSNAMDELLQFAAIATVCDVMELKDENRIIVKEGLKRLKSTENEGLKALIEVNGVETSKLSAYHLGFVIGPCLNATGRLDTAKRALELLQSRTRADAMSAARELKDLNDSRKNLTLQGVELAEEYIEQKQIQNDDVMLIYLPEVHESLAGIIAGRIREKYNHPVFVLTKGEDGVKGSGRSIEGYHMYEAMTQVKHFFTKFGGHKLAAGLSMEEKDIEALRQALNANSKLTEEDFAPKVHIDVPMPLSYADERLAGELERLEPFGVGNPKPLFAQKELTFLAGYKMGANKSFARYRVSTPEGMISQLVFFGDLDKFGAYLREQYGEDSEERLYAGKGEYKLSVVYQLSRNTYRGKTELQFIMQNYC